MKRFTLIITLILFVQKIHLVAGQIEKGYEALSIYDYFKAKKIFYSLIKKKNSSAYYGLSLIYFRKDNPFHQLDSALKYAVAGANLLRNENKEYQFQNFQINSVSFSNLIDSSTLLLMQQIKPLYSVHKLNHLLQRSYSASPNIRKDLINLRDEIEWDKALSYAKSDSTIQFILTHPLSVYIKEALQQRDIQIFNEQTAPKTETSYFNFITKNPNSQMLNSAYRELFEIFKKNEDKGGLKKFVHAFPNSPYFEKAWKFLFSLSVKTFNTDELQLFLSENPEFPFKNSILKELELNKIILIPYFDSEFYGFITENGNKKIHCMYESAQAFSEGLSVVSKNDSTFFINKENEIAFNEIYEEAFSFHNGLAPVKQNKQWHLINRQGIKLHSFEEIYELSDGIYVFKSNEKYGAIDQYGKIILEPQFNKLGYFKNGFAYYSVGSKYGFVSKEGSVYKADFSWISDFDDNKQAIIKKDNLYGIIHASGKIILEPQFDQIQKCKNQIYLLVKNYQYGFYHGSDCYLSEIKYEYKLEFPIQYYCNGNYLRLNQNNNSTIVNLNGKVIAETGALDEVNFFSNGLMRVKKKNKFGYVDKKLNITIPYKFTEAEDFEDSLAIVKLKDDNLIINTKGQTIYQTKEKIEKINANYFFIGDEEKTLIDANGKEFLKGIDFFEIYNKKTLIITLSSGQIKLLNL
ncbi:MAG: WG repeat-containing protein [Sphingobacteriaceae bacterium]|nr:WG repeat-containing protein [Sphingobacteriaceae bacterium]